MNPHSATTTASADIAHQTSCERCRHHDLCRPTPEKPVVGRRIRVARNTPLYQAGELASNSIYAVRSGSFKTLRAGPDGETGVVGFTMNTEFLALNEIGQKQQTCTVVALEDSEVCKIAWKRLACGGHGESLSRAGMNALLSGEIRREQAVALMLRNTHADQRLASFLLSLSQRHHANGYSASQFRLQMPRGDIASFLGISAECLSRLIVQLTRQALIEVRQRDVTLLNLPALQQLAGGPSTPG